MALTQAMGRWRHC